MVAKGLLRGPDSQFYPPWDEAWGQKPADYPSSSKSQRRQRVESPVPALASSLARNLEKLDRQRKELGLFRPEAAGRSPVRRRAWFTPTSRRRLWWGAVAVGVVAITANDKSGIVHLLRTAIGASVSIVDATADVAVSLLEAGGNATVAVTSVFVDPMSLSSSVVDDAWRGVDLHNVRATRRVGRLLTENVSVALQWLRESGPTEAGNATLKIADSMGVLINLASPVAEFEDSCYDPQGLLVSGFARGRVFESGATAMSFVVTETTFSPCWSNPVWAQLEYPVGTESTRILQLATSVASALPATHNDALALPHPGLLFQASPPI